MKNKKIRNLIIVSAITAGAIFVYGRMAINFQKEYRQTLIDIESSNTADSIRRQFVKDSTRVADSLTQIQIKKYWSSDEASSGGHYVKGYRRKNGTWVSGHWRK